MTIAPARRLFTVDEYHRMASAGILRENDRVELLEGEIVQMSPIGKRHAAAVDRLTDLFAESIRPRAIIRVQGPIRLGPRSEPQPDLALLRPRSDFYASRMPDPGDVLLVVEVADESAARDRDEKLPLYAAAGIPEAWLWDLDAMAVAVCRDPGPEGCRNIRHVTADGILSPLAFPDVRISAADLFRNL